jgi:O-antigen ligase
MKSARAVRKADRFVFWTTLVFLVWLPLPWASHVPWAASLLVSAVYALLTIWLMLAAGGMVRLDPRRATRLLWPLLIWLLWIGWIACQIIQINPETLASYSPQAFGQWQFVADAGLVSPSTISISSGVTVDALLLTLSYFGLYWLIVLMCWRQPERLRLVLGALVLSGLLQALYGSLMTLSSVEYGFLAKKVYYTGFATGTFVNRNHLAGYLELTAAAGVGLILADLLPARETTTWRQRISDLITLLFSNKLRVRVALCIMAIGIVLTRSRMGNTAFFVSLCVCGLAYILLRERQLAVKAILLFASLLLVDVLIVSNWFGLSNVVDRIEKTELATESRVQLNDELQPVVVAYAKTGSGLGTFAQAYAPFRSASMSSYMDHAHNDYLEFIIEVGLPGFVILLLFVGAHALHALHVIVRRRSRLPAAVCFSALMALVAYAIHATVEFNLQIPANAATLVVLLALCACCSAKSSAKKPSDDGETCELKKAAAVV